MHVLITLQEILTWYNNLPYGELQGYSTVQYIFSAVYMLYIYLLIGPASAAAAI